MKLLLLMIFFAFFHCTTIFYLEKKIKPTKSQLTYKKNNSHLESSIQYLPMKDYFHKIVNSPKEKVSKTNVSSSFPYALLFKLQLKNLKTTPFKFNPSAILLNYSNKKIKAYHHQTYQKKFPKTLFFSFEKEIFLSHQKEIILPSKTSTNLYLVFPMVPYPYHTFNISLKKKNQIILNYQFTNFIQRVRK